MSRFQHKAPNAKQPVNWQPRADSLEEAAARVARRLQAIENPANHAFVMRMTNQSKKSRKRRRNERKRIAAQVAKRQKH